MVIKIGKISGLEDGKTYHVIVGNLKKDIYPSSRELDQIGHKLKNINPSIKWVVTGPEITIKGDNKEEKLRKKYPLVKI